MKPCLLCVPALLVCGVAAQVPQVSPARYAGVEAPGVLLRPFFFNQVEVRVLQVHEDLQTAGTYRGVAFRRDVVATSSPAVRLTYDMWMSTAATTAATVDQTFDLNHGRDRVQVANRAVVQFPARSGQALPNAFEYRFPTQQPFAFGGGGPLCWDLRLDPASGDGWSSDATFAHGVPGQVLDLASFSFGRGCLRDASGFPMQHVVGSTTSSPLLAEFRVAGAQPFAPTFVAFGSSRDRWGLLTLPFEIPGSTAAPSGTCQVLNAWSIVVPLLVDGHGTGELALVLRGLRPGQGTFTQGVSLSPNANALGIITSNSYQSQVTAVGPMPIGLVHSFHRGNAVYLQGGLVVQID